MGSRLTKNPKCLRQAGGQKSSEFRMEESACRCRSMRIRTGSSFAPKAGCLQHPAAVFVPNCRACLTSVAEEELKHSTAEHMLQNNFL
jgi:hypothetical protein